MLNVYDKHERILGIVVSNTHERKAFTYCRVDKYDALYEPYKILLYFLGFKT